MHDLQHERGFADTRIAADQQRRAAHEAATGGAVKLAYAGDDARRILDVADRIAAADRDLGETIRAMATEYDYLALSRILDKG